jgi:hypothetical protein
MVADKALDKEDWVCFISGTSRFHWSMRRGLVGCFLLDPLEIESFFDVTEESESAAAGAGRFQEAVPALAGIGQWRNEQRGSTVLFLGL